MKKAIKWGGIIILIIAVIAAISGNNEVSQTEKADLTSPAVETEVIIDQDFVEAETSTTTDTERNDQDSISEETMSQKNAVKKANSYINYSAFSRQGLISQLEFDEFSNEDAVYAVDTIDVDWNKQAARKAKSYLDYTAFSRNGLISQLEFDGFTTEQAIYGVDSVGL